MANPKRSILIDASLLGMGRVPGNLCIEQIIDHLNFEYGNNYRVEPVFDAVDDYIAPIKKKIPWGYLQNIIFIEHMQNSWLISGN